MPILYGTSFQAAKRAIGTIVGARKYDHTLPLFQNLKLLNIREICIHCVQILMYKYHHDLLPSVFSYSYVQNNSVHEYHTRQENLLHVPLIRTVPFSKSVRVTVVSLYNDFKSLICLKVSYVTYKYNLKRLIFDNNTLNLVKTSWPKLPWCTVYHFDKFQIVTMEALSSLHQD